MKINILIFFSLIFFIGCTDKIEKKHLKGEVFGSTYSILYYGTENYQSSIDSIFYEINLSLNTYDTSSVLSKWNLNKSTQIDDRIIYLFQESLEINQLSEGYFDPTVGGLVDFYGFGTVDSIRNPTQKELDVLLASVGIAKLKLENMDLIKFNSNTKLDFNSIAPGYTADLIADFFKSKKIGNFLVDIGGEIIAGGKKEDANFWVVGVENPTKSIKNRQVLQKVKLSGLSLATSGSYRKIRKDEKGQLISHTINPNTGKANASNMLSVTILANSTLLADGIATTCMSLGLEKSRKFLKENSKFPAFIIYQGNNSIEFEYQNGFEKYIK